MSFLITPLSLLFLSLFLLVDFFFLLIASGIFFSLALLVILIVAVILWIYFVKSWIFKN